MAADDVVEVEAREVQQTLEFYTQSHSQQSRDPVWASVNEERISDFLAKGEFAGTSLEQIDCRTTQCRVILTHQGEDAVRRLGEAWGQGPFRYGGYSHFDEKAQSTTVYLGREGYEFQYPDLGLSDDDI